MKLLTADPATKAKVIGAHTARGSTERYVDRNGELNASTPFEALKRAIEIAERIQKGDFSEAINEEVASPAERRAALEMAFNDPTGQAWQELGVALSATVQQAVVRSGFARRLLGQGNVVQGGIPRVRTRRRNVMAVTAIGPSQVATQTVREQYIYPAEFNIVGSFRVTNTELDQGADDLLNEKYVDMQETFLVGEDRVWKNLADKAAPIENSIQYFSGSLTPTTISTMKQELAKWSLPAMSMLLSMDLVSDLTVGTNFQNMYDPVTQLEIVTTGRLGVLLGMDLITDGFRDERLKVLDAGEIYVTTAPDYLGAYTDRGGIQAEPRVNEGNVPGRGWFGYEAMSMAIANARGIAKGKRT